MLDVSATAGGRRKEERVEQWEFRPRGAVVEAITLYGGAVRKEET